MRALLECSNPGSLILARYLEVGFALLGVKIMGNYVEKLSASNIQGTGNIRQVIGDPTSYR